MGMSLPTTVTVTVEAEKPPTGERSQDLPKSSAARGAKRLWVPLRLRLTGAGGWPCSARHRPDGEDGTQFQQQMDAECHLSRRSVSGANVAKVLQAKPKGSACRVGGVSSREGGRIALCDTCCFGWQSRGQEMETTGRKRAIHHRETCLILFRQLSLVVLE